MDQFETKDLLSQWNSFSNLQASSNYSALNYDGFCKEIITGQSNDLSCCVSTFNYKELINGLLKQASRASVRPGRRTTRCEGASLEYSKAVHACRKNYTNSIKNGTNSNDSGKGSDDSGFFPSSSGFGSNSGRNGSSSNINGGGSSGRSGSASGIRSGSAGASASGKGSRSGSGSGSQGGNKKSGSGNSGPHRRTLKVFDNMIVSEEIENQKNRNLRSNGNRVLDDATTNNISFSSSSGRTSSGFGSREGSSSGRPTSSSGKNNSSNNNTDNQLYAQFQAS
jgi:hypothetical protein